MQTETETARVGSTGGGKGAGVVSTHSRGHSTPFGQGCKPVRDHRGHVIGRVKGAVFHKRVRASKHQLRHPPSWAFDIDSLAEAMELGADLVVIHEVETGTAYSAPVLLICQRGFWFDRGHGQQIALPLKHWGVRGEQAPSDVRHPGGEQAQQLALDLDRCETA